MKMKQLLTHLSILGLGHMILIGSIGELIVEIRSTMPQLGLVILFVATAILAFLGIGVFYLTIYMQTSK